jgi:hypothetical protein
MKLRLVLATLLAIGVTTSGLAQASRDARFKILGTMIAEQAAARIAMPFGQDGFEVTDTGSVDQPKIDQQIKKNGVSIEPGKLVTITAIDFGDNRIEFELDGGGKNKKAWYEKIEVGMGGRTTPVGGDKDTKAKGTKITLKFSKKVPPEITTEQLHELLGPVLDFTKQVVEKSGIAALPPEYQEAVRAKEARIGMDRNTVILALGRPDDRSRDTDAQGTDQETWIYRGRGTRTTFVWFKSDVVVKIAQY